MQKSYLLFLFLVLLFSACIDTDDQIYENAVHVILQNYGGEVAYGPGVGIGVGDKGTQYDYFSVELSNSVLLQYGISPAEVISHIATEFAKVTPPKFSEIEVVLNLENADGELENFTHQIPVEELKLIIQQESIFHEAIQHIATGNIDKLTTSFTAEGLAGFEQMNKESPISNMSDFIGAFQSSQFRGYEIMSNDSHPGKDFILLHGLAMGSKQNAIVGVIIDPAKADDKSIVALRY